MIITIIILIIIIIFIIITIIIIITIVALDYNEWHLTCDNISASWGQRGYMNSWGWYVVIGDFRPYLTLKLAVSYMISNFSDPIILLID